VRAGLVKKREEYIAEMRRLSTAKAELMIPDSFVPALKERGIVIPLTEKTKKPSITKALFEKYEGDELIDAIARAARSTPSSTPSSTAISWPSDSRAGSIANGSSSRTMAAEQLPASLRQPEPQQRACTRRRTRPLYAAFSCRTGEEWQSDDECLTGDTQIITIDGIKTIRELCCQACSCIGY